MKKLAAILMVSMGLASGDAAAQSVQTGMLQCRSGPRVGLLVGSFQRLNCVFQSTSGRRERYSAREGRVGLDVGITAGSVMAWAVYAPSAGLAPGALAGKYAGASGDIAFGLGVGANALIGGSSRSVALQPLSVEGQVGVALALGVTGLTLVYQP